MRKKEPVTYHEITVYGDIDQIKKDYKGYFKGIRVDIQDILRPTGCIFIFNTTIKQGLVIFKQITKEHKKAKITHEYLPI